MRKSGKCAAFFRFYLQFSKKSSIFAAQRFYTSCTQYKHIQNKGIDYSYYYEQSEN